MENVVALEVARAAMEKFGGDSLIETLDNQRRYTATARLLPLEEPGGPAIA